MSLPDFLRQVGLDTDSKPSVACRLLAASKVCRGGDGQNRTDDPLRAKQMLSQLSYAPDMMVGLERLELSTSRLSGVRSNHLSYRPIWTYFFQRAFGSLQVKNELDFSKRR